MPVSHQFEEPWVFEIRFDMHQGDLVFDVAGLARREDDRDRVYRPLRWEASPPGGHHRSGTLKFPAPGADSGRIRLVLSGIYGIPERTFEWDLKSRS